MSDLLTERVLVVLSKREYDTLVKLAAEERTSVSKLVRSSIKGEREKVLIGVPHGKGEHIVSVAVTKFWREIFDIVKEETGMSITKQIRHRLYN